MVAALSPLSLSLLSARVSCVAALCDTVKSVMVPHAGPPIYITPTLLNICLSSMDHSLTPLHTSRPPYHIKFHSFITYLLTYLLTAGW